MVIGAPVLLGCLTCVCSVGVAVILHLVLKPLEAMPVGRPVEMPLEMPLDPGRVLLLPPMGYGAGDPLPGVAPLPDEAPLAGEAPLPDEAPLAGEAPLPDEAPLAGEAALPGEAPLLVAPLVGRLAIAVYVTVTSGP